MISGIINVRKEAGYTSFDVVALLRGITRQKKIGHTGTLDPDATGVLPVCFGAATKLCDYLTDKVKEYEATFKLGIETDTQDISGTVISERNVTMVNITDSEAYISREKLEECIMSFIGKIEQIPPMYSAIKVDGKKLYELAREGKEVERKPRSIEIFGIEIKSIDEENCEAVIRVECSKGTYIRTLCYDIGRKLGCGATMTSLVRTKSGNFELEDALTIEQIEDMLVDIPFEIELPARRDKRLRKARDPEKVAKALESVTIPVDKVFENYPELQVEGEQLRRVLNGNYVNHDYIGDCIRVYGPDRRFLAIYEFSKRDNKYKPQKMFLE